MPLPLLPAPSALPRRHACITLQSLLVWACATSAPAVLAQAVTSPPDSPVRFEADRMSGRAGTSTVAEGHVRMERNDIKVEADRVEYTPSERSAAASGRVKLETSEAQIEGPSLKLNLDTYQGVFESPRYRFKQNSAGGHAERFEFIDSQRGNAVGATYSSCRPEDYPDDETLPWELKTRRVRLDFESNVGVAEGAVLRFYGVPVLAAPVMSFPLSDDRKSGWLPPLTGFDTRGGYSLAVPWYWNIAPQHDATLTPMLATKRGFGLGGEYRYLQPDYAGTLNLHEQWHDPIVDRQRWSGLWQHDGHPTADTELQARWHRASDDEYWKDFPHLLNSLTPRLLSSDGAARMHWEHGLGRTTAYLGAQHWQVLQEPTALIIAPYNRELQGGVRGFGHNEGIDWQWETEATRFSHPDNTKIQGSRVHAKAHVGRSFGNEGYTFTPRLGVTAVGYDTDRPMSDGSTRARVVLPTLSLDNAWVLERDTQLFGNPVTQTLEPRLLYVNTPYRAQSKLPHFDTATNDFNFDSVFSDNTFSGMDRISDAHQITGGITSRFLDSKTGAEALRLGVVQRVLLRDQRVTADDGPPLTQRWSDLLLLGSTSIVPHWYFDSQLQYSPDISRVTRSSVTARFMPGPYRTINTTYRYNRRQSEQVDVGWQWPIWGPATGSKATGEPAGRCSGSLYSVGRTNYSLRESRLTDSLLGFEYDAGCWVGRIFASRLSTGVSQAVTSFGLEIEFVGLSRVPIGSTMKALRDNIPGYQPLRGETSRPAGTESTTP